MLLIGYEMYRHLVTQNSPHRDEYNKFFLDPGPSLVVADEGHILKTKDVSWVILYIKVETNYNYNETFFRQNLMMFLGV